jgi:hypothetical protein
MKTKIMVLIVVFSYIMSIPLVISAQSPTDASSTIGVAKAQLTNAYQSALQAEQAGANITELTTTLNEAGLLLSQAEQAYSIGDYSSSQSLAVQCQEKLGDFTTRSDALKEVAVQQETQAFWVGTVYPIFGSLAVIVVGVAIWFVLKRKYGVSGGDVHGSSTV